MMRGVGRRRDGRRSRVAARSCADSLYVILPSRIGTRRKRRYACGVQHDEPATRHLTFLFADVEGSTRLVERHGSAAGAALSRYHELVASGAEHHGGRVSSASVMAPMPPSPTRSRPLSPPTSCRQPLPSAIGAFSAACGFASHW